MNENKRVLVAEDSSSIQMVTRKVLMFLNYKIDSAKNGEEVMKKVNSTNYDIILMDINMPKIDGMECARQIRSMEDEAKSKVPIIAITGNAKNYSIEDFKKAGIDEYLQKPLDFDLLGDTVQKYT